LAATVKSTHPKIDVETKPGGKGDFLVKLDGVVLWDKRRRDDSRFPEANEILSQLSPR
jgi:predicted Rdx family selenoprotein